ncbi:MAG TPA: hypothetical protein V6D13_12220 [Halomicronema sp.]
MNQELRNLKNSILEGRYEDALLIVDELESMSKEYNLNKIRFYVIRILSKIIKIQIEHHLTNYSKASISESLNNIKNLNCKDNKNYYYVKPNEWSKILKESLEQSLDLASVEVLDGTIEPEKISEIIDKNQLFEISQQLLNLTYEYSSNELTQIIRQKLTQLFGIKKWQKKN